MLRMSVNYKVPDINTFDIINSRNRSRPKVAIPGADHKERGLLGRDSNNNNCPHLFGPFQNLKKASREQIQRLTVTG